MRREDGSATLVAAAIIGLVMVLALGASDVARTLAAVARAQTAADAAALAAAQELVLPSEFDPTEAAAEYASRNGAVLVACECPPGAFEATVAVRVDVGRLLLLGGERSVTARARAIVDPPGG